MWIKQQGAYPRGMTPATPPPLHTPCSAATPILLASWGGPQSRVVLVLELGMQSHGTEPVQMAVICHLNRSEVFQPDPHAAVLAIEAHHYMPCTPS